MAGEVEFTRLVMGVLQGMGKAHGFTGPFMVSYVPSGHVYKVVDLESCAALMVTEEELGMAMEVSPAAGQVVTEAEE